MALRDLDLTTDDEFRCAPWTAAQGIDPIGSATRMDRLVTVEAPGPWPRDVADHRWIAGVEVPAGTRIHTVLADAPRPNGSVLVTRWSRRHSRFVGTEWAVPAAEVPTAVAVLAAGDDWEAPGTPAPPEVLVCAHGARDRCCGSFGTRLAVDARDALAPHRVRRVSHLGGHRYAPTAMTMPDGRFWAFLDLDMLVGIVERTAPAGEAREFYRGNSALDPWGQVVEAALLPSRGWSAFELDRLAGSTDVDADGNAAAVEVSMRCAGVEETLGARVEITQHYPVLQCGLPPEEATKEAAAYTVVGDVAGL